MVEVVVAGSRRRRTTRPCPSRSRPRAPRDSRSDPGPRSRRPRCAGGVCRRTGSVRPGRSVCPLDEHHVGHGHPAILGRCFGVGRLDFRVPWRRAHRHPRRTPLRSPMSPARDRGIMATPTSGILLDQPDRNLALELVRATEAAAIRAVPFIGRGDKNGGRRRRGGCDAQLPRDGQLRRHGRDRRGREGQGADALQRRASSATAAARECDIAVDPIDGTSLTAAGRQNAISMIAASDRGTMLDASTRVLHGQDRDRARRASASSTSASRSARTSARSRRRRASRSARWSSACSTVRVTSS